MTRNTARQLAMWLSVVCWACSAAPVQAPGPAPATPSFARVEYPKPQTPPATEAQPQPTLPPQDPDIPVAANTKAGDELDLLPEAVKNAAVRDQETEHLVRSYFAVAEALYRVASAKKPAAAGDVDTYDPVPLARLQAQIVGELARLARRAAILQMRFLEVAQDDHVGLTGDPDVPGRTGRLRFFFQLCSCVRRDAEDRTAQGMAYLRALQTGATDDDWRAKELPAKRFVADMQMFGRTVECSRLASRAWRTLP